jgi:hypothetical protein
MGALPRKVTIRMSGPKDKGWARGGSVEAVKASVLVLALLVVDMFMVSFVVMKGRTLAIEVLLALLFINLLEIALAGHFAILSSIRNGMWTKVYPLSDSTVLDSIQGYLDSAHIGFRSTGEEHTYTENYSDVLECGDASKKRPLLVIKLMPVTFPDDGVRVLVGPESKKNKMIIMDFMLAFDDVVEIDLNEGISRVAKKGKENKEEE